MQTKTLLVTIALSALTLKCATNSLKTSNNALPTPSYVEQLSESPKLSAQQRLRFLTAMQKGEKYGLRRTEYSVEGTPIYLSLITASGKLTLITDYRDDPYSTKQKYTEHPVSVGMGKIKPEEQHALRSWFPAPDTEYLRCLMQDGNVAFF